VISSLNKLNNAALAGILFMSVFQTFNLLLNGFLVISFCYFISGALCAKALIVAANLNSQIHKKLSSWAVLVFWLPFISTILFETDELPAAHVEWAYLLLLCSFLLLSQRLFNLIASIYFLLIFSKYLMAAPNHFNIEMILSPAVFIIIVNLLSLHLKGLTKALSDAETTDETTGCANTSRLKDELAKAVDLKNRYATKVSCITLSFTIPTEKILQQELWLKELAQVCQSRLRNTDLLCRYNDLKFIILLPNTSQDNAHILSSDLLKACQNYEFTYTKQQVHEKANHTTPAFKFIVFEYLGDQNWESWLKDLSS
jgi:GGDEF domain-containing protein